MNRVEKSYQHRTSDQHHQAEMEDHGAGITFPSLWKREASPLQPLIRRYNVQTFIISPTLRSQEIAKGRLEMMEMIRDVPESSYELSLKDLIIEQELPMVQGLIGEVGHGIDEEGSGSDSTSTNDGTATNINNTKRNKKGERNGNRVPRTESMTNKNNGGQFLLRLFFPVTFGSKQNTKKSSKKPAISSKVSPRPPQLMEVQKNRVHNNKESPRKRLSAAATSENTRTIQSRSRRSSVSTNSRSTGGFLHGCWSFNNNKAKTSRQKKEPVLKRNDV